MRVLPLGLVVGLIASCLCEEAPVPQGAAPVGRRTIVVDPTRKIKMAPYRNLPRQSVSEGTNILKKLTAGLKKPEIDPVATAASMVRAEKMVKKMKGVHIKGMRRMENRRERINVPPQKVPKDDIRVEPDHHLIAHAKQAFGADWEE